MRATAIPGPVRVALVVDAGIAAIYGLATVVGVPDGRFGTALVGGEAAAWAGVVLTWVFRTFWARWSAAVERLFALRDVDADVDNHATGAVAAGPDALAPLPSRGALLAGGAALTVLVALQALTTSGAGVAFRSVVAAYVVAGAVGAAALAVVSDVSTLLAMSRSED